ncbi:Lipoprotein-releasing system ATP-binding protein LolD [Olavius algarvensis associated proteobacterium Delta 3]|nr:Lipoprotein-releasing system ATP-binding protein LolD [Olavius algarvensis associated proteobacterium Delta 3]CAB5131216.1 Lipoprotein-releasing system ATP-binding protein LolD [Olavius algarvensis associated proteobacterium Delta 3]
MGNQNHPPEVLVQVRQLRKGFNASGSRLEILDGIDVDLKPAETMAVVGASGIGKSTLLHILGTLDRPDSGQVLFQGDDVFRYDDARLARFRNRSIGFVFQFHHLLPEFSAKENVMMPALIQGLERHAAEDAAVNILMRVGLQPRLNHRVSELSGGEQQRVAIARALVLRPKMLLADEPTGNLDRKNSSQFHEILMELNAELGMTMVVVTHNPELAALMSRHMTIAEGKLVEAC